MNLLVIVVVIFSIGEGVLEKRIVPLPAGTTFEECVVKVDPALMVVNQQNPERSAYVGCFHVSGVWL